MNIWTPAEKFKLKQYKEAGLSLKKIAQLLNKSYDSVCHASSKYTEPIVSKWNKGKKSKIIKLLKQGWLIKEIAQELDETYDAVREAIKRYCLRENANEKIGFLDIETFGFGFKADKAIILVYCLKELNGRIIEGILTSKEIANKNDKRLLTNMINDIKKFDKIVTFYGGDYHFDLPLVRTKCVHYGIAFPSYGLVKGLDLWNIIKKKYCLSRNDMRSVCKFFGIPAKATQFSFDEWYEGVVNKKLDKILQHCKEDVISTEEIYKKIYSDVPASNRSL